MLQQNEPEDFVLATGVTTEIREFIRLAFEIAGIQVSFVGEAIDEKAIVTAMAQGVGVTIGQVVMAIDPKYFRPTEVDLLLGNPQKAFDKLGWKPKYTMSTLCKEMVEADIVLFKKEQLLKDAGYSIKNEFE